MGLLLIVVLIFFFLRREIAPEMVPVKIGAVLALTGDLATVGQEIQKGIQLAQQEAQDQGVTIEVLYEDGHSLDAAAAVSAAKKLVEVEGVHVGLTGIIQEAKPIAPIFAARQVPLVATWDSDKFIETASDYLFSTGFSTEKAGEKMATYAFNDLGLRKIAVINQLDAWSETISAAFIAKFTSLGGEVAVHEEYQPAEKDFRTFITKAKDAQVDGIYFPLVIGTCVDFLTQAARLNVEATLLSADSLLQDDIDAAGAAAEGVYYTNFFTPESKAEKLTTEYKAMFNSDPVDITLVSFGYDGFNTIREAVEKSGPDNIQRGLLRVIGSSRTLDRIENIYKVTDGKPALIK